MKIVVVLFATLVDYHPQGKGTEPFMIELPEGSTIKDVINHLGIVNNEAKQAFVRHKSRPDDFQLQDGDRVAIFPPVAGG